MKRLSVTLTIGLLLNVVNLYAQSIEQLQRGKPSSVRGLSVVDDSVAWLSGSGGYIAITRNGGKNWDWQQVKGFEKADFRDIEAFSDKEAIIMSSGTPALVLKTADGGASWQVKYRNTDTAWFFDAMDFADKKHGFILGDPIKNKFLLMETKDAGETWEMFKDLPYAIPGEAAFAASGTCLRLNGKQILIASGGSAARLLSYRKSWSYVNLPVTHGKPSKGAFSVAIDKNKGIVTGGDYENDKKPDSTTAIYTLGSNAMFNGPVTGPAGFQSCVELIAGDTYVATGTSGSNITTDGGKTWSKIDGTSFNVCSKAKHGKLILFAGNGGETGILKL